MKGEKMFIWLGVVIATVALSLFTVHYFHLFLHRKDDDTRFRYLDRRLGKCNIFGWRISHPVFSKVYPVIMCGVIVLVVLSPFFVEYQKIEENYTPYVEKKDGRLKPVRFVAWTVGKEVVIVPDPRCLHPFMRLVDSGDVRTLTDNGKVRMANLGLAYQHKSPEDFQQLELKGVKLNELEDQLEKDLRHFFLTHEEELEKILAEADVSSHKKREVFYGKVQSYINDELPHPAGVEIVINVCGGGIREWD